MKKSFDSFRFGDLDFKNASNKFYTMNRVSENEEKIVVKVEDVHLVETAKGYVLVLDRTRVLFLKKWQVDRNWFGNEVLLFKSNFDFIRTCEENNDFSDNDDEEIMFEAWLEVAKIQREAGNKVKWAK